MVRLTDTQRRIWAAQRLHPDVPLANMGDRIRLAGVIDPGRFVASFDAVVQHSAMLRSVVVDADSIEVLPRSPRTTEVLDLDLDDLDDWIAARVGVPIDATRCVYDSVLLRHADDDWTWWLCIHHVATDATSSALVVSATSSAYLADVDPAAAPLEMLTGDVGHLDVHPGPTGGPVANDARSPTTDAPTTRPGLGLTVGPPTTRSDRYAVDATVVERVHAALDGPYRTLSTDLGALVLAAMSLALLARRFDGADEITIGVPMHGRGRRVDAGVVGPMMRTVPWVVHADPDESHGETFRRLTRDVMRLVRRPSEEHAAASLVVNVATAEYPDVAGVPSSRCWVRSGHDDPTQLVGVQVFRDGGATTWMVDVDHALGPDRSQVATWFERQLAAIVDAPDARPSTASIGLDDVAELRAL
ncbi:MAG: condensation domain-containing protein, partial [Actinomycetota bacterium]